MNRRSFLKLPTLLPLIDFGSAFRSEAHHFQYESVIGTSMDLVGLFTVFPCRRGCVSDGP